MKQYEYQHIERHDLKALNQLGAEGWRPASPLAESWVTTHKTGDDYYTEHQVFSGLMMREIETTPDTDAENK